MVVPGRMYGIGGTGNREFRGARGPIARTLGDTTAETCCAYNMLKLSRMLFFHEQKPSYGDYYERALYHQVLGSEQDTADAEKPLVTYFIGLVPGHVRDYATKAGTTCCEGTGMESATKYQDCVYVRRADGTALYVNLYSPSTLTRAEKGITVTRSTGCPAQQSSTLVIRGRTARFDLCLRVPAWATSGFRVTVNGKPVKGPWSPGGYASVSRTWRDGDTVRVLIRFRLRVEKTPDGIEFAPFSEGTEEPAHACFTGARARWSSTSGPPWPPGWPRDCSARRTAGAWSPRRRRRLRILSGPGRGHLARARRPRALPQDGCPRLW